MKAFLYFITLSFSISVFAQNEIQLELVSKSPVNSIVNIAIDNLGAEYTIVDNTITRKINGIAYPYNNYVLGNISSISIYNPLKLNVFYRDFNTAVILDNRLAEITKVNFNQIHLQRIVSHISTAHNNNIWLFNENSRQMELFDFITQKTTLQTLPITGKVFDIDSNYNSCWILTDTFIYNINYFGSIVSKINNDGYEELALINENILLRKENSLYFLSGDSKEIKPLNLPELLIKQFFVTNETLYIYDHDFLYSYQLITN